MKKKAAKTFNPMAHALRHGSNRPQVIKNKKREANRTARGKVKFD